MADATPPVGSFKAGRVKVDGLRMISAQPILDRSGKSRTDTNLRALIFDFDGLICDTEGCLVIAAREVFAARGASLPMDRWLDTIGRHSERDVWVPWLEKAIGMTVDHDAVLAEFDAHNHALIARLDANPGVRSLLDAADRRHIPVAVASSSPTDWVEPLLDQLGLRGRFVTVVCREHAPRAKPAPDLYLEALQRLDVPATSAVAFEDSYNGSLAAVAAGIACVVVPNEITASQDFHHAEAVVESLADLDIDCIADLLQH